MKQRSHAFDLLCGICIVRMITQHVVSACGYESTSMWTETGLNTQEITVLLGTWFIIAAAL